MKKKEIIETVDSITNKLPKTMNELDVAGSTVLKVFNLVTIPIRALSSYLENKYTVFEQSLNSKIESIPKENRQDPDLFTVGKALEDLKYCIDEDELSEMFENLLSSCADSRKEVSPAFSEIIKQLTSSEARILKSLDFETGIGYGLIDVVINDTKEGTHQILKTCFTNIFRGISQNIESIPIYLNNFERLGLIKFSQSMLANKSIYERIENDVLLIPYRNMVLQSNKKVEFKRYAFQITDFGIAFAKVCIRKK